MARRLRIEYAGALYQLTLRGNTEKDTYRDDIDRTPFLRCLPKSATSFNWVIF